MKVLLTDLDFTLINDNKVRPILVRELSIFLNLDQNKLSKMIDFFYLLFNDKTYYINSSSKSALWKRVFNKFKIKYNPRIIYEVNAFFWEIVDKNIQVSDQALQTLEILKEKEFVIAVVSGGDYLSRYKKLEITGLLKYIDFLIVSEEFGFKKSKKDLYLKAIKEIKVSVKDCIVIGDDENDDIILPKKDGFKTIRVNPGRKSKADYQVKEFKNILDLDI